MEDESNRDQLIRVSEENLWHGRFVEAEKVNDQLRRELATEKVLAEQLSEHAKSKVGDTVTEELFNDLWHIAHPDDERWEYPAQIFREVRDFADQLRRKLDEAVAALRKVPADEIPLNLGNEISDLLKRLDGGEGA